MPVNWNDDKVIAEIRKAVMRGIVRGTESVRATAVSLILNTDKSGRTYYRRSVVHQASAAGEPPASDTGRLVNSIETKYSFEELAGVVNVSVDYGAHLEFGTRNMAPRPFLRPALAMRMPDIEREITEELRKVL